MLDEALQLQGHSEGNMRRSLNMMSPMVEARNDVPTLNTQHTTHNTKTHNTQHNDTTASPGRKQLNSFKVEETRVTVLVG